MNKKYPSENVNSIILKIILLYYILIFQPLLSYNNKNIIVWACSKRNLIDKKPKSNVHVYLCVNSESAKNINTIHILWRYSS